MYYNTKLPKRKDSAMAKNTGKDYREKNRIRLQRHYERQAAAGKKRVTAVIPGETHGLLMAEKEKTGLPISEIIEAALLERYKDLNGTSQKAEAVQPEMGHASAETAAPEAPIHQDAEPEKDPEVDQGAAAQADVSDPAAIQEPKHRADDGTKQPEPVTQAGRAHADIIPDCAGKTLKIDERDEMVRKVMEALPGRANVQNRLDLLNRKSVPVKTRSAQYGGTWTRQKLKDNLKGARDRLKKNQAAAGIRFSEKSSSTK
jgi:hypothetical protein